MKQFVKQSWVTWTALLLTLPTVYFILISLLNNKMEADVPMDSTWPGIESVSTRESIGGSVNLLILLGPVVQGKLNL